MTDTHFGFGCCRIQIACTRCISEQGRSWKQGRTRWFPPRSTRRRGTESGLRIWRNGAGWWDPTITTSRGAIWTFSAEEVHAWAHPCVHWTWPPMDRVRTMGGTATMWRWPQRGFTGRVTKPCSRWSSGWPLIRRRIVLPPSGITAPVGVEAAVIWSGRVSPVWDWSRWYEFDGCM